MRSVTKLKDTATVVSYVSGHFLSISGEREPTVFRVAIETTRPGLRGWSTADTAAGEKAGGKAEFGFDKRGTILPMHIATSLNRACECSGAARRPSGMEWDSWELSAQGGSKEVSDFCATGGLFQSSPSVDDPDSTGLAYVAPEVLQNPGAELRPYTDIYGLGMILYELLAARPPFTGQTARETLEQVRLQVPVPPGRVNSRVTAQLDDFCLRCLSKDPWRRYARAYNLIKRLRYFQENPENRAAGSTP